MFPVNPQSFQVLDPCRAATEACHLVHGLCQGHTETFFGNARSMFDSSQTPHQGILHSTNPSATGTIPAQVSTGKPVARSEERIGSTTPMPMTTRPSTINSFLTKEIPQILWLHSKDCRYRSFTPSSFSCWKIRFKTHAGSCSDFISKAMLWIKEVEIVDSVDE